LAALKEFSDLGAGFKIAALDLELRGAGNMLGGEQSGHIEAIGFELYTQMLEEAVSKLKGDGREDRLQVTVNLGISLRIDESYISEENQRLRMYKRIAGASSLAMLTEIRDELQDRYGQPPENVQHLLAVGEVRLICEQLSIAQIERKRVAVDEQKKSASAPSKPTSQTVQWAGREVTRPGNAWQPSTMLSRTQPLAGRHGQAPQTASLQFSSRAALNRSAESNAAKAVREVTASRTTSSPLAQAGRMKPMRDMLFVTFSEKLHAAPAESGKGINVGALMKLVSRNAKNGAQLTPQGVLRWPLSSSDAETVLTEIRELLSSLEDAKPSV
jgi:transcription-repair coupling factor (superfamily II helicase)